MANCHGSPCWHGHGAGISRRLYSFSERVAPPFSFSITHDSTVSSYRFITLLHMFHNHSSSTLSNFQLIFDDALKTYKKHTKKDLLKHPLAERLQSCDSPSSMLTVLQEQVQELNQSERSNTKWLDPTVNVLHVFSETLGEGVSSVCFRT